MATTGAMTPDGDASRVLEPLEAAELPERRGSPGVLVLALPLQLIHITPRAEQLLRRVKDREGGSLNSNDPAKGFLPPSVRQAFRELSKRLRARTHNKDSERFEFCRLVGAPEQPVLLRGFGVPDLSGRGQTRVILVLEEIGRSKGTLKGKTPLGFRLTEREEAVLKHLARGCTNKEIASALNIALPTVKEHIRHLMNKTKTTTRTGILMRVRCR